MKTLLFLLIATTAVCTTQARTLVAANTANIIRNNEPTSTSDCYTCGAVVMGTTGWTAFNFVMISPCGTWYVVDTSGNMYKSFVPNTPTQGASAWLNRATLIAQGTFLNYPFVFFAHTGDLFAINPAGQFLTRFAPLGTFDNWVSGASTIGTQGWNTFRFVFFNPNNGNLMAYAGGSTGTLYEGAPPTSANPLTATQWIQTARVAGTLQWDIFDKLFFNRDGNLYGVDKQGGFWRASPPNSNGQYTYATQLGSGYTQYKFLFFRL